MNIFNKHAAFVRACAPAHVKSVNNVPQRCTFRCNQFVSTTGSGVYVSMCVITCVVIIYYNLKLYLYRWLPVSTKFFLQLMICVQLKRKRFFYCSTFYLFFKPKFSKFVRSYSWSNRYDKYVVKFIYCINKIE